MSSSNSTQTQSSGGIGLGGAVFIVFLVLKLIGQIGWSWWWVTAPLWLGPVIIVAIFLVVVLFVLLGKGLIWLWDSR